MSPASASPPSVTPTTDRVPFHSKAAYGAANISDLFVGHIPQQLTQPIFVLLLGMSPAVLSSVAIIFRLWDAFIDPFIGMKSDNARTRWGRRKPFMVVGCVLTALWFPMLWIVAPTWSPAAIVGWYVFAMLVLATTQSLWGVCYQSMLLEITPDYAERTSVTAFRTFFTSFASMGVAWVWYLTQLPVFYDATGKPDTLLGIRVIAVIASVFILVLGLLPVFFVKERFREVASNQPKISMRESIRLTFSNRPFVLLASVSLLFLIGTYTVTGMTFYINLFHVFQGDMVKAATLQGITGSLSLVAGLLGIPIFQGISNRIGKTKTLGICIAVVLAGSLITWFTMTPEYPYLSMVGGLLNTPGYTGLWMLIPSMTADVADHDELQTHERREGSFASIYSWIFKVSQTIAYGLTGPMIVLAGFQAGVKTLPPPDVLLNMRLLYAFLPAAFLIPAIILLTRYPLSEKVVGDIRAQLEARRGVV